MPDILQNSQVFRVCLKGTLVLQCRTWPWLVSPASGCEKKKWNPPILDKILPLKLSLDTLDTLATSNIELAPKYGQNIVKLSKFSWLDSPKTALKENWKFRTIFNWPKKSLIYSWYRVPLWIVPPYLKRKHPSYKCRQAEAGASKSDVILPYWELCLIT